MSLALLLVLLTGPGIGQDHFQAAPPRPGTPPGRAFPYLNEAQLSNGRTGVTCTLRVVPAGTSTDAGMIRSLPQRRSHPDRILRNDLSPCVEGR